MPTTEVEALNDKTCIVCREDMAEARKLPCQHAFHSDCLMLWVQNGSNCPTCRKDIISSSDSSTSNTAPEENGAVNDGAEIEDHNVQAISALNENISNMPLSNEEQLPTPSTPVEPTLQQNLNFFNDTPNSEDMFPVNLGNLIPIYQGIPHRLRDLVEKNKELDSFTVQELNNVRYLLKETDSLLMAGMGFSPNVVVDGGSQVETINKKQEKLRQAIRNLSKAQSIIQDELRKVP